MYFLPSNINRN